MSVQGLTDRDAPIVAVATAPGRGAVGIVRASGRDLSALVRAVCGKALAPREATYLDFLDAQGQALDRGLALHFPAPHSYTGEDVLELQAHGGPVVLQMLVTRCLQALPGARLARPGEFTERAFLNDKLDLAQAEAVADLIDASTEAAARCAGRALAGEFSDRVDALSQRLVKLRTLVEATLDFPEEEIDFLQQADAAGQLHGLHQALRDLSAQARQGALLREGLRVVIAGQPNVGKSSLLNALAGAELAIVTPIAGTTRDRVSEAIQIEGVPVYITDTAGLRAQELAHDEVERIGIGRSWEAIVMADVVLFLHDLTRHGRDATYDALEQEITAEIGLRKPAGVPLLHVWNKVDATQGPQATVAGDDPGDVPSNEAVSISAQTGEGLQALRSRLLKLAGWQATNEGVFIARERHVQALKRAQDHLDAAQSHLDPAALALDLLAEELRLAHAALSEITGAFTADDLLGEIFGKFCIGK